MVHCSESDSSVEIPCKYGIFCVKTPKELLFKVIISMLSLRRHHDTDCCATGKCFCLATPLFKLKVYVLDSKLT